jgi:hypothetical protein
MTQQYDDSESVGFVKLSITPQHPELADEVILRTIPIESRFLNEKQLVARPVFVDSEIKSVAWQVVDSEPMELGSGVRYAVTNDGLYLVPQINSSAVACREALLLDNGKQANGFAVRHEVISDLATLYTSLTNHGIDCTLMEQTFNATDAECSLKRQLELIAHFANKGDGVLISGAVVLQSIQLVAGKPEPTFFIVDAIDFTLRTACIREPGFAWAITVELDAIERHLDEEKLAFIAVETSKLI